MKLLKGKKIADDILENIKQEIITKNVHPGLGVVLVGKDPASQIYVSLKEKAAKKVGMIFEKKLLEETASQKEIIQAVKDLNDNKQISGIIVQLPLPSDIDEDMVIEAIHSQKDADGFHKDNLEKFFADEDVVSPVFPQAILALIKSSGVDLQNKKGVIVVNSNQFGKTMQKFLEKEKMRATYLLHDQLNENIEKIRKADVLITACGIPKLINDSHVKDGAIVIDGGICKDDLGKTVGDVDVKTFSNRNIFLSPVPGGVGPLTIACLLRNVLENYKKEHQHES